MESKEREYKRLRFGLALKKIIDANFSSALEGIHSKDKSKRLITTIRRLESASGIPNSSLVQIVNGKKNASWSTIDAILEGLEITLSQFAVVYDSLLKDEIVGYKKEIEKKRMERAVKKKLTDKSALKKVFPKKKKKI